MSQFTDAMFFNAWTSSRGMVTDDDHVALMQLASGSTGSPKAVQISHRNFVANAEAMVLGCDFDVDTNKTVSWLPCFHDMGMTGYLAVPMYSGAELVKITPMDFLRDTLLWARLIDKYRGTMTAAPNFAYSLFAKRLRTQATPGEYYLSSLRWALSGAEQVDPVDVEELCAAGRGGRTPPRSINNTGGVVHTGRDRRSRLGGVLSMLMGGAARQPGFLR